MRPLSGIRLIVALLFSHIAAPAHGQGQTATPAHGQGPLFCVYFNAGNIKYIPVHNGPTRPLGFHNWLFNGDRIVLQDNIAELILFDRDSNYLRLDGKGNYTIADLAKLPHRRLSDSITVRYLSLLWNGAPRSAMYAPAAPFIPGPPRAYTTSLDTMIFRWGRTSWAQKYFLRIRSLRGDLLYDSVLADTQAFVNFAARRITPGNTYHWALDLIGISGRLQFGDSGHIVLIDEAAVYPQLPPLPEDSLGGIAAVLRKIEQYQAFGCIRHASDLFRRLDADFPTDEAIDMMYQDFLRRNYMR